MMLLQNEIIKYTIHIQDIYDLIDTLIIQYPKISIISLSLPGIIDQGKVFSTYIEGIENINLEEKLKQRYNQQITLYNDINSATAGYYVIHQEKEDLFLFPSNFFECRSGSRVYNQWKTYRRLWQFCGRSFLSTIAAFS